jgi:hypothetical protein
MVLQITCASIIFGLGLGCIVLIAEAADTMNKYADGGTVFPQDIRFSHGFLLSYIPEQWVTAGNNSILAAGVFSVLAGFLGFVLLGVKDFYITVVGGFIVLSSTITSVFALIFSMVSYYSNDNDWGYYDQYSTNGSYTVEGWTCTLSQVRQTCLCFHPFLGVKIFAGILRDFDSSILGSFP